MKTKDRIIQASIELFNEFGERAITTNHIAAHLGISPGNLYYHFRNKEDIINSIFIEYIAHIDASFRPTEGPMTVADLAHYCDEAFTSIWRFRFFYSSLPGILLRDESLQQKYLAVQEQISERTGVILKAFRDCDVIDIDDASIVDLVQLIKMVVAFWISYQMCQSSDVKIEVPAVYDGVVKLIALVKPYATESALADFDALQDTYRARSDL
ncbi:TetR/AcrR family transcriptional regulator [Echinimonas agarilytica]|uniref:TetR/AcrR family transcriptional regulator n=1 Tax=Echinimonas agarilytica TaxID=1215918 RepID=A0AA41W8I3_9GAMM|nr:TetR/AcrR family transcriptional regulator [Echinimonas agarilytica]MCM2680930.1 TetR/AcrR family transcriptional regulator [Echinimonas agarilytica]